MRGTPSAAFQGSMAAVRSTDEYDSQLFADETRRLETSAPRRCASLPVTYRGSGSQGSAVEPGGKSRSPGI